MKSILLTTIIMTTTFAFSQELPEAVSRSFHKQFPNKEISSWQDNSNYQFYTDWDEDTYFADYNLDGFTDTAKEEVFGVEPGSDIQSIYMVPLDHVIEDLRPPTLYQINFIKNERRMASIFTPDGTFVMAKERVRLLPNIVRSALLGEFKGKTIKVGNDIEKMIVPNQPLAIYRVKVEIQHGKEHILKIDENGTIISNRAL
ncbi:hypothetical protein [Pareuzebyella sediminis]|uniref:hypothetical protein n=1 Tax=Pareuzebyella sediminis TaxID=2607998 RepID=UPI0011EDEFCD|nr:hypothetical protein [Pareuzebyella sediminis]